MIDCCGIFGSASGTKFDILLGGIGLASILAWHGLVALSIGILFLGIITFRQSHDHAPPGHQNAALNDW